MPFKGSIHSSFKEIQKLMENEMITICNEKREHIGVATRAEIHKKGYWHETFHCWFLSNNEGKVFLYLQIRSDQKKDYPNLLDITAAGHILADESIHDGIREVKEELGIDLAIDDVVSLGVFQDCITTNAIIDKEFGNVFLYARNHIDFSQFHLQQDEVSGIVKTPITDFEQLIAGHIEEILVEGFKINQHGKKSSISTMINKHSIVPHEQSYFENVLFAMKKHV